MHLRWDEEAPRLARLARLQLSDEEARTLAAACDVITRDFAQLATFAQALADADAPAPGPLREDEIQAASDEEVAGILAAAPHVDAATRAVLVPRGLP